MQGLGYFVSKSAELLINFPKRIQIYNPNNHPEKYVNKNIQSHQIFILITVLIASPFPVI